MLEVSRVGVMESDDEIELSLGLSIGGSYKKLEKSLEEEENSGKEISEKKKAILLPRSGLSFPPTAIVGDKVERGSGSGSSEVVVEDYYSQRNKREIQALRRQEARKKREEKLRKSASNSNSTNVVGVANADDKMLLETQQLQSRARDREMRENDALVEDKDSAGRKERNFEKCIGNEKNGSSNTIIKDSNFIFTSRNNGGVSDGSQDHQGSGSKPPPPPAAVSFLQNNVPYYPQFLQCAAQKNGLAHPRQNHNRNHNHNHMVESCIGHNLGKDENGSTKGKNVMSQPANFRPYPNGNGNLKREGDSEQNSGKCGSEIPKVVSSNGSPERTSSSAVSDYRSTSGKGGSSSESGSHSSSIGANEQQFGGSPILNGMVMMPQIIASEKKDSGRPQGGGGRRRSAETNEAAADSVSAARLPRMPCVSTTGNGPNGKTVTGFLYRYTKTEVSIVCVCHGTSFSPAEFVEHAGGATAVTNPLRHITMVPSPFSD